MTDSYKESVVERSGSQAQPMSAPEPIVIVGMGCRLPADVNSPSDLWRMLREDRSGHCKIPLSRWNKDGFYDPDPDYPGTLHHDGGYFIKDDVRAFDNSFFGISNLEAISMDPEQRNLLEVVYQCLESAGAKLEDVSGRNIGCYVGNFTTDYINISLKDPDNITRYGATGMGTTLLSNRISHIYNLAGPSFVIDTACSSSLYALHNACLALEAGEIEAALVCGTNLLMSPEQQVAAVKAGVISPTSTCHSFDECADGYGRADGIGALYIKRLSDAIRGRDPIRSIIRGTALNCNGRTLGITLPSIEGQEAVIRKAYSKAGVTLHETDYVECHGTGTKVGDPIEVEALSRVFSNDRKDPLLLGSVKTNLGHSEAASGIASIIKATLMLETATIPPTHGLKRINPNIKTDEWNVRVVTQNEPWPGKSLRKLRRVSINSFGYGGANAHAILENVDNFIPDLSESHDTGPNNYWTYLLPFSAKTQDGLLRCVRGHAQQGIQSHALTDLAYTLGCRRSFFPTRGFLLARPCSVVEDLQEKNLATFQGQISQAPSPIAMIFTGQGAQWPQMGLALIEENASFLSIIQGLDTYLQTLREAPPWTIEQTLRAVAGESHVDYPCRSQPVCTAVQIALVDLFRKWRIVPQLVVGHSSGEIAAAYAAGHITSNDAVTIAYYRGLVVARNRSRGAMMAIGMSEQDANAEITSACLQDNIRVACKNSPQSSTLSGDEDAIDILFERLSSRKAFARKLPTNGVAYHSYDMANLGMSYQDLLSTYLPRRDGVKNDALTPRMISSVTGNDIDATQTAHPAYWRANLESPVEFAKAMSIALRDGAYHFLELGPHSVLELPLKQIHAHERVKSPFLYASALVKGTNSIQSCLKAVGKLFVSGYDVDFSHINAISCEDSIVSDIPIGKVLPNLPIYPWQHDKILWNESRMSTEYRSRKHSRHDLLGSKIPGGSTRNAAWRNLLRLREVPWLADHQLEDSIVFPAAGYLAMAVEALSRISLPSSTSSRFFFRSVHFLKPLIMPADSNSVVEMFTDMTACRLSRTTDSDTWYEFEISSVASDKATLLVTGSLCVDTQEVASMIPNTGQFEENLEPSNPKRWYERFAALGLNFGPRFQSIRGMQVPRNQSQRILKSEVLVSRGGNTGLHRESTYALHPVIIDAMLQSDLLADSCGGLAQLRAGLPVSIDEFILTEPEPKLLARMLSVRAVASEAGHGTILGDVELHDAEGRSIALMHGVRFKEILTQRAHSKPPLQSSILNFTWKPSVEYLQPSSYETFLDHMRYEAISPVGTGTEQCVRQLAGFLDLIMHKNPTCRILEIDAPASGQDAFGDTVRAIVKHETLYRRCSTYAQGSLGADGSIAVIAHLTGEVNPMPKHFSNHEKFDVVIFRESRSVKLWLANVQHQVQTWLVDGAWLLCLESDCEVQLSANSFNVLSVHYDSVQSPVVARLGLDTRILSAKASNNIVLVVPDEYSEIVGCISRRFVATAPYPVQEIKLSEISLKTIQNDTAVVTLIELEKSVLSSLKKEEMQAIKIMNKTARSVLWVTGGDLLCAARPDMSIVLGLFRTMRLEQYPTKFGTLDVDYPKTTVEIISQSISQVLLAIEKQPRDDDEFVLRRGVLYVSRMTPQTSFDSLIASKGGELYKWNQEANIPRRQMGTLRLAIRQPGNISTIYLQQCQQALERMQDEEVELEVLAVGLNAKDLYGLMGRVNTRASTSTLECTGIVRALGGGVSSLHLGDRVVAMAPQKFSTRIRVPMSSCCKLLAHESHLEMATVPMVFSSALYALRYRAQLQPHESVLIHSATGGLGQAAIQVAKLLGAEVFATAGTDEKRRYTHDVLGVTQSHIFSSHDTSFLAGVKRETGGRGVDVILNSLTGDLLHAGWRCLAAFGRFVEVGRKDIAEAGRLDMSVFERAASFTAFDLTELYYSRDPVQNRIWSDLLFQSMGLVRDGTFHPIKPLKVFGLSDVKQAFQYFAASYRLGKVAVEVTDSDPTSSVANVVADRYMTTLSPHKTYLMVGCLGGIGRHLSRWMLSRGARSFMFMGRSSTNSLAAKLLIEDLARAGAKVQVIRGDVGNAEAVTTALTKAETPIGGVVQAAMSLKESLFSDMDILDWHLGLAPKVKGTWNLHHCLHGHDGHLDFFLMTSSITGSIGQATESNYSAANGFLDAFARYRRRLGLPGTSMALGAVKGIGYLAEHPEAEAILQRQGFLAIDEDELLYIVDLAISGGQGWSESARTNIEHSSLLTGLDEQNSVQRVMEDPRARILASRVSRFSPKDHSASSDKGSELPEPVMATLSACDEKALYTAVESEFVGKMATLVQMPAEQITAQTKLADIGIDSMLAVEARREATLGTEVSLMDFTAAKATVGKISEKVAESLLKGADNTY